MKLLCRLWLLPHWQGHSKDTYQNINTENQGPAIFMDLQGSSAESYLHCIAEHSQAVNFLALLALKSVPDHSKLSRDCFFALLENFRANTASEENRRTARMRRAQLLSLRLRRCRHFHVRCPHDCKARKLKASERADSCSG